MDSEELVKCYYFILIKISRTFVSKDIRIRKCNGCINKDIAEADREYHKQCIVRNGVLNRDVHLAKKKATKANLNEHDKTAKCMKAQDLNYVGGRECVAEVLNVRQMLWGLSPASAAEVVKELTEANMMPVLVERIEEI